MMMTWLKRHKFVFLLPALAALIVFLSLLLRLRPLAGYAELPTVHVTSSAERNLSAIARMVSSPETSSEVVKLQTVENRHNELHHMFFLKVHKAASTTVMNILYRFAIDRGLHVMLPREGNILSQDSKTWRSSAIDLPWGVKYFDILCNHLIFNEDLIRNSLPTNAKFVGIVRNPLSQFVSAFEYYRDVFQVSYLTGIPGPDPVLNYLKSPETYEPDFGSSYTHNRMSFDFGMDIDGLTGNDTAIKRYVNYLNQTFDLVMISERFDESVILLKRLMGWRMQDVLYIRNNIYTKDSADHKESIDTSPQERNFTEQEIQTHRTFNAADYALYENFAELFQKRVEAETTDFDEEVSCFKAVRRKVIHFCKKKQAKVVRVRATRWSDSFQVSRSDCKLMTMKECPFVDMMRLALH